MWQTPLRTWKETTQAVVSSALIISTAVGLLLALLGAVFVTQRDFLDEAGKNEATRRHVRFVACALVLDLEVCQRAHGIRIDELLEDPR